MSKIYKTSQKFLILFSVWELKVTKLFIMLNFEIKFKFSVLGLVYFLKYKNIYIFHQNLIFQILKLSLSNLLPFFLNVKIKLEFSKIVL